ncbi:hypothetical protein SLEP1_g51876 [Rubroshorea leprosula]|uniref:NB-ARC domain-containing protein n=1 Tax=Rubroshorea leprosula TaxID=152421 RepID=A0AAV5M5L4_9ROSI|nr:hypothetical protein SLEP1_g51876 [Rubroshorea leprosula]
MSKYLVLQLAFSLTKGRIEVEVHSGQVVKEEVKGWLEDVQKIEQDIQDVEERVGTVPSYKRASLDKDVRKIIEEVKRIQERRIFEGGLGIERAPACGIVIPTENLEGEISTRDEIWEHLMGNKVGMIGVCGIGGVGKTTIMKHVNNDLLTGNRFQKVIWVIVSYPLNIFEVQKEIAEAMGVKLQDEKQMRRAAALMEIMRRKTFVLILDDVWEKFSLKDVGIPEPTVQNGCKVVITSRSVEVCKFLDCEIVKVQPLSQEESLNLFLDKVGRAVLQNVPELEETLKLIVKECAGLPLAIVVIAGSMKGVDDIKVWRNALTELQECVKSVKGSDDEIFMRLKFSFDRLPNEKIKNCFLYCSLFREDYSFVWEELIEGWIDEGLMDGLRSREAAYDRGHAFLDVLEKNSLLEKDFSFEEAIKMHDVVRDMAIKSIGPGVGYMVKAGMKLTEVPNEHEWARDLNKVSLMANDISKIPVGLIPKCPTLSTLILSDNPLTEIPESFFEDMSRLKVLDLSRTHVEALPSSISKLKYLSALRLRRCNKLKCLPSLEKLVALKKLDLQWARIEVVPQGMEIDCEEIEYMVELDSSFSSSCKPILDKLEDLRLWGLPRLWALVRVEGVATPSRVFSNLKTLQIFSCLGMRKLLLIELLPAFQNLEVIGVDGCEQMEEIIVSSDSDASSDKFSFIFPKLRRLQLWRLPQLKSICSAKGVMVCDSIEYISIGECPKLKRIPVQLPMLDNGQPSAPPHLKGIGIDRLSKEWWESLEWDHPNTKNILRPFLKIN